MYFFITITTLIRPKSSIEEDKKKDKILFNKDFFSTN